MKLLAKLLVVVFIAFLATPTVIMVIKKSSNTSIAYSFSEEEFHKEVKEVKAEVKQHFDYPFLDLKITKDTTIISENLSRHDNISSEILSPPPEFA